MKKKFLLVLSALAVSCLFWACGSGEVLHVTQADEVVSMGYTGDGATEAAALNRMVNTAVSQYCQGNEDCISVTQPGGYVAPQPESSSSSAINGYNPDMSFSSPSTSGF